MVIELVNISLRVSECRQQGHVNDFTGIVILFTLISMAVKRLSVVSIGNSHKKELAVLKIDNETAVFFEPL